MIELRWITRTIVGSEIDPADEFRGDVLQYRVYGKHNDEDQRLVKMWGPWKDVPHSPQGERLSAYDGRKLNEDQDANGR